MQIAPVLLAVDWAANLRNAVLVEGFDGNIVALACGQCAEFERVLLIAEDLVGLAEFFLSDAPQNVIADCSRNSLPGNESIAAVSVAAHRESARCPGRLAVALAKYPKITDSQIS